MTQAHEELRVQAQRREDGKVTVTVRLIGWDPGTLTSLVQRPVLTTRIASRIALAVYEVFGTTEAAENAKGDSPVTPE